MMLPDILIHVIPCLCTMSHGKYDVYSCTYEQLWYYTYSTIDGTVLHGSHVLIIPRLLFLQLYPTMLAAGCIGPHVNTNRNYTMG